MQFFQCIVRQGILYRAVLNMNRMMRVAVKHVNFKEFGVQTFMSLIQDFDGDRSDYHVTLVFCASPQESERLTRRNIIVLGRERYESYDLERLVLKD
jgi:hypothetical protein